VFSHNFFGRLVFNLMGSSFRYEWRRGGFWRCLNVAMISLAGWPPGVMVVMMVVVAAVVVSAAVVVIMELGVIVGVLMTMMTMNYEAGDRGDRGAVVC